MKISVAMCTYNGSAFLAEQLDSIAAQTRPPDEVVVCDDRSTDATAEIVNGFAAKSPFPVRFVVNEINLGVVGNFEKAISLCTGDIIALSDQDDVWMPEKLAIFEREFNQKPHLGFVFTDGEIVDERLNSLNRQVWDYFFTKSKQRLFEQGRQIDVLLWTNTVTGATAALRAELKTRLIPLPADAEFIHDGWIALLAACHSHVSFVPQPLIKYRQHGNQQCGLPKRSDKPDQNLSLKEQHRKTLDSLHARVRALQAALDFCSQRQSEEQSETEKPAVSLKPLETAKNELSRVIGELEEMIKHLERRTALPASRLQRLKIVSNELLAGNYSRYSKGVGSAIKDLLEAS
ncbi:MAG: glycosyltransferase family 2 protein [Acidobacteriota bacterium]|nr:glycosyltransferase family 2 protein [Acidobacteriota bacterium]